MVIMLVKHHVEHLACRKNSLLAVLPHMIMSSSYDKCRNYDSFTDCSRCGQLFSMSVDWIGLCSVLCPCQHSIGYMGDGFYRSKDPTNSIKVLKEKATKENNPENTKKTQNTHMHTHTK